MFSYCYALVIFTFLWKKYNKKLSTVERMKNSLFPYNNLATCWAFVFSQVTPTTHCLLEAIHFNFRSNIFCYNSSNCAKKKFKCKLRQDQQPLTLWRDKVNTQGMHYTSKIIQALTFQQWFWLQNSEENNSKYPHFFTFL